MKRVDPMGGLKPVGKFWFSPRTFVEKLRIAEEKQVQSQVSLIISSNVGLG
jgi:hypothetical protein